MDHGSPPEDHHSNRRTDIENRADDPQSQPQVNERMNDPELCRGLSQAALKGDWETANSIESQHPGALTKTINDREETVLHIATRVNKVSFVRELVNHLTLNQRYLGSKNRYGNTALCIAAASGALDIAKIMVEQNENLTLIRGCGNATPLLIAATYEHRHMVSYLFDKTLRRGLAVNEQIEFLVEAISADYYDVALLILNRNKSLASKRVNQITPLHIMARKSGAIGKKAKPTMFESCINSGFKCKYKKTMMQIQAHQLVKTMLAEVSQLGNWKGFINEPSSMLHDAAKVGNVEFLRMLIDSFPDIVWNEDAERKTIFHIAVEARQKRVFNLIYEMGEFLDYLPDCFVDEENSLLKLATKMPNSNYLKQVSGAAFQLHDELVWFKEVEKIEKLARGRMKENQSAREAFTKEHKELVEEGEKWIKKTANSCMLVATLIATVVFAAGFTLPGGVNNNTGFPVFLQRKWFTIFVISDAIALMSSSSSILLFLSILTSQCAEDDFFFRLPCILGLGLGTLFLSVLTMVIAFSASFFLSYGKDADRVPLVIAGMAIAPVFIFTVLQFNLLVDAVRALYATWLSVILFRNRKRKAFWMSNIKAPLKRICC